MSIASRPNIREKHMSTKGVARDFDACPREIGEP